mmetsp:Transcript_7138/g.24781  ORF Transcript_7138/g.24781 Transcript_7138/m.24781 type:complete len:276 (+) Transcript_7138:195-1022(+)
MGDEGMRTVTKKVCPQGKLSSALSAYFRSYAKGAGAEDVHVPVFRALKRIQNLEQVLYPGCHRHITPSLFFPRVHYVDCDEKVGDIYRDAKALDFINDNKEYTQQTVVSFSRGDFFSSSPVVEEEYFDLVISLSAGNVSEPCGRYLKEGGYLLVNEAHGDAYRAYLDQRFELAAVYDEDSQQFDTSSDVVKECFHTRGGEELTKAMFDEIMLKPKSRRPNKLRFQRDAMFYLFRMKGEGKAIKPDHVQPSELQVPSRIQKKRRTGVRGCECNSVS